MRDRTYDREYKALQESHERLLEALESIKACAKSLHTMKGGQKVWATNENREFKIAIINIATDAITLAERKE